MEGHRAVGIAASLPVVQVGARVAQNSGRSRDRRRDQVRPPVATSRAPLPSTCVLLARPVTASPATGPSLRTPPARDSWDPIAASMRLSRPRRHAQLPHLPPAVRLALLYCGIGMAPADNAR